MNQTESNFTKVITDCTLFLFSSDFLDIILNALRFLFLFLYVFWSYFAIRCKELRKKSMAHLYNVALNAFMRSIYGIHLSFLPKCFEPSKTYCAFQTFFNIFFIYTSSYTICFLAQYRLIIVYFQKLTPKCNKKVITATIALSWILPIFFLMLFYVIFDPQPVYLMNYKQCLPKVNLYYPSIMFTLFIAFILPDILLIFAYITTVLKIRSNKRKANSTECTKAPQITFKLVIYILAVHITQASYTFDMVVVSNNQTLTILAQVNKLVKWIQDYCPIALLYFHPLMTKKYESFGRKILLKLKSNFMCCKNKIIDSSLI